ncbi:MAG: universal stress protein [Limisphaerales bacterium]
MKLDRTDDALLNQPETPLVSLQRILVPIDFSACSMQALQWAVPFARHFGATLELVHVVTPSYAIDPCGLNEYAQAESWETEDAKARLEELAGSAGPDLPVESHVRRGRPASEIVGAARDLKADLIVISTHGYCGLERVFLGSTAENVVRHADCPVLTIRAKASDSSKKERQPDEDKSRKVEG